MDKAKKEALVAEMHELFQSSKAAIVVDAKVLKPIKLLSFVSSCLNKIQE